MEYATVRRDSTEKTITLGLLDLFPASTETLKVVDFERAAARLSGGAAVSVLGGTVVPDRPRGPDEDAFVMRPSATLRLRRGARSALSRLSAGLRPVALATTLRAALPGVLPLARACVLELLRVRVVAAGAVGDLRALAPAERRTAVGGFLAGVVLASVVAWMM